MSQALAEIYTLSLHDALPIWRTFGLALEEPQDGDLKLNVDGYDFIIEEETVGDYGKFTVDYSNSFLRKGFVITDDRGGGGRC